MKMNRLIAAAAVCLATSFSVTLACDGHAKASNASTTKEATVQTAKSEGCSATKTANAKECATMKECSTAKTAKASSKACCATKAKTADTKTADNKTVTAEPATAAASTAVPVAPVSEVKADK